MNLHLQRKINLKNLISLVHLAKQVLNLSSRIMVIMIFCLRVLANRIEDNNDYSGGN